MGGHDILFLAVFKDPKSYYGKIVQTTAIVSDKEELKKKSAEDILFMLVQLMKHQIKANMFTEIPNPPDSSFVLFEIPIMCEEIDSRKHDQTERKTRFTLHSRRILSS